MSKSQSFVDYHTFSYKDFLMKTSLSDDKPMFKNVCVHEVPVSAKVLTEAFAQLSGSFGSVDFEKELLDRGVPKSHGRFGLTANRVADGCGYA